MTFAISHSHSDCPPVLAYSSYTLRRAPLLVCSFYFWHTCARRYDIVVGAQFYLYLDGYTALDQYSTLDAHDPSFCSTASG